MKNKVYQKVLKRVVRVVASLVFLLSIMSFAHAEEYFVELKDYKLSVWDLSGSYYTYASYHAQVSLYFDFIIVQDAKGKVTGYGNVEFGALGYYFDMPVEFKGKMKAKNDIVTLEIKKMQNDMTFNLPYGESFWAKITINKLKAVLNQETGTMYGTAKAKMCVKANVQGQKIKGCDPADEIEMDLDIPYGMTGEAVLLIDVEPEGKKLGGTAELRLSNDDVYPLVAKGKYNSKKVESKFALKGSTEASEKIKFKLKIDEGSGAVMDIKGKALGQKLKL